jgi:uncharacterized protein YaaR (DUF327 family)
MANIDIISNLTAFLNPAPNNAHSGAKKTKETSKTRFFTLFEHSVQETVPSDIPDESPVSEKELLDEVHVSGDELKNRPFPEEIIRYKRAVRNFLQYVVKNGYTTERQISGANLMKRKKFTLVQVIDQKLEQLAVGILAGQTTQLEILANLEEIKGLLVDFLH